MMMTIMMKRTNGRTDGWTDGWRDASLRPSRPFVSYMEFDTDEWATTFRWL